MFFLSGTRSAVKKLGYVADFCPSCQSIQPFLLSRKGVGEHAYFVPIGSSKTLDHVAQCLTCQVGYSVNPLIYKDHARTPGESVEALVAATFPDVRAIHAGRIEMARLLKEGRLGSSERALMLSDVWLGFARQSEENAGGIQLGGKGGMLLLLTFAVATALAISSIWLPPDWHARVFQTMGLVLVVGFLVSIILIALDPGRMRRELMGRLATNLRPFSSSPDEIATYLGRLSKVGYKLGRQIKADKLTEKIRATTGSGTPPPLRV